MKTAWPMLALLVFLPLSAAAGRPAFVDLRPFQTPVRDQAQRGNCFIHATIAAMEAALRRGGNGDLNLSEEFSDYVGTLLFLETDEFDGPYRTDRMRVPGPFERESGMIAGDVPSGTIESTVSAAPCSVLGVPDERYMPYSSLQFDPEGHPDPKDPWWNSQFNVSSYMLSPKRIPLSALSAPTYYRVKNITWLSKEDSKNPEAIERVLAGGHEVIWDFRYYGDPSHKVWQYTGPALDSTMPHRMVIVGYDRRVATNRVFIVKNSWGHPGDNDPGDDFTYISYGYIAYGEWASYISELAPPAPWPELAFVGRWDVKFADRTGLLDIYHLPGMMQASMDHCNFRDERGERIIDRRLGTFYEGGDPERAFRVNGILRGNSASMYIDFDNPGQRWEHLRGTKLDVKLDGNTRSRFDGTWRAQGGRETTVAGIRRMHVVSPASTAPAARSVGDTEETHGIQEEAAAKLAANDAGPVPDARPDVEAKSKACDFLGAPETDFLTCPDGRGRYIHYEGGSIYWSPATGAHAIYGAIRQKWAEMGWERSALGYPASDEEDSPDGKGRMSIFEHGRIVWYPDGIIDVMIDDGKTAPGKQQDLKACGK